MNSHPILILNTDATKFPEWATVRSTLSAHGQLHWGRLGMPDWQWLMPISQQRSGVKRHLSAQRSLKFHRVKVRAAALNRQPLIQYP